MTEIKICGLFRDCDIDYVNEARPEYAGFILRYPKSHRNVTEREAARLRKRLAPGIRAVGVFVNQTLQDAEAAAKWIGLDVIQLHGREDNTYIEDLRKRTGLPVWKAFRVRSLKDLSEASESIADGILLDGGLGEGQAFNWDLLKNFGRPFFLAGGLTPENIPEAADLLHPALLDISSGVETEKKKDREKILAAVQAARGRIGEEENDESGKIRNPRWTVYSGNTDECGD
ncbi:MAG: phosphoribosylanthranilate isomerase [Clostridium sp.]|nr:phosphoribosylanthranilate isomerase [Clostridium sp.]